MILFTDSQIGNNLDHSIPNIQKIAKDTLKSSCSFSQSHRGFSEGGGVYGEQKLQQHSRGAGEEGGRLVMEDFLSEKKDLELHLLLSQHSICTDWLQSVHISKKIQTDFWGVLAAWRYPC